MTDPPARPSRLRRVAFVVAALVALGAGVAVLPPSSLVVWLFLVGAAAAAVAVAVAVWHLLTATD